MLRWLVVIVLTLASAPVARAQGASPVARIAALREQIRDDLGQANAQRVLERRAADDRERRILEDFARLEAELVNSQNPNERQVAALLGQGRVREALDVLQRLAEAAPSHEAARLWRALGVLSADAAPERSRSANLRASELAPRDFDILEAVARDDVDVGKLDSAEAYADRLGALVLGDVLRRGKVLALRASIAWGRGRLTESAPLYEEAATELRRVAGGSAEVWETACDAVLAAQRARAEAGDQVARSSLSRAVVECGRSAARAIGGPAGDHELARALRAAGAWEAHANRAVAATLLDEAELASVRASASEPRSAFLRGRVEGALIRATIDALGGADANARARFEGAVVLARAMAAASRPQADDEAASRRANADYSLMIARRAYGEFLLEVGEAAAAAEQLDSAILALRAQLQEGARLSAEEALVGVLVARARAASMLGRRTDVAAAFAEAIELTRNIVARRPDRAMDFLGVFSAAARALNWSNGEERTRATALLDEAEQLAAGRLAQRNTVREAAEWAALLTLRARMDSATNDTTQALRRIEQARAVFVSISGQLDPAGLRDFETLMVASQVLRARRQFAEAELLCRENESRAILAFERFGSEVARESRRHAMECLVDVAQLRGNREAMRAEAQRALAFLSSAEAPREDAWLLASRGILTLMLALAQDELAVMSRHATSSILLLQRAFERDRSPFIASHLGSAALAASMASASAGAGAIDFNELLSRPDTLWYNRPPFDEAKRRFPDSETGEPAAMRAAIAYARMQHVDHPSEQSELLLFYSLTAPYFLEGRNTVRSPNEVLRIGERLAEQGGAEAKMPLLALLSRLMIHFGDRNDEANEVAYARRLVAVSREHAHLFNTSELRRFLAAEITEARFTLMEASGRTGGAIIYSPENQPVSAFDAAILREAIEVADLQIDLLEGIPLNERGFSDENKLMRYWLSVGIESANLADVARANGAFEQVETVYRRCRRLGRAAATRGTPDFQGDVIVGVDASSWLECQQHRVELAREWRRGLRGFMARAARER